MNQTRQTEPPRRIPARGGCEQDVFGSWRRILCYTSRPNVCQRAKRAYTRRLRKITKLILSKSAPTEREADPRVATPVVADLMETTWIG